MQQCTNTGNVIDSKNHELEEPENMRHRTSNPEREVLRDVTSTRGQSRDTQMLRNSETYQSYRRILKPVGKLHCRAKSERLVSVHSDENKHDQDSEGTAVNRLNDDVRFVRAYPTRPRLLQETPSSAPQLGSSALIDSNVSVVQGSRFTLEGQVDPARLPPSEDSPSTRRKPHLHSSSSLPESLYSESSSSNTSATRTLRINPSFEPFYSGTLSVEKVTHQTFDIMRSALTDKKESDFGYIYMLSMAERPRFVKIGRTKRPIAKRMKNINRCIPYTLKALNNDDFCPVANHTRVEKLIHAELYNYRRKFPCRCGQNSHDGDANDGMVQHGEWFEIDMNRATKTVARWRSWMNTKPYCNGTLRNQQELRINYYDREPLRMKVTRRSEAEDWHWNQFMRCPTWRFWWLQVQAWIFDERSRNSTCSVWDSLKSHWQPNLLLYLTILTWTCSISLLETLLGSSWKSLFLNTTAMSILAVFYAA